MVLVFGLAQCLSIIELMNLTPKMLDLAKLNVSVESKGPMTAAYLLDPSIHTFLKQYKTRT